MSSEITPALSRAEWAGVLANREQLAAIREQFSGLPFSSHALAALFLYEEPFGFSAQDVDDEIQVADYCDHMAVEQELAGEPALAATFRLLGGRHRIRAAKIAALLPPIPDTGTSDGPTSNGHLPMN
jgi:hypothetical protein